MSESAVIKTRIQSTTNSSQFYITNRDNTTISFLLPDQ